MDKRYVPTFEGLQPKYTIEFPDLHAKKPVAWITTGDTGTFKVPLFLRSDVAAKVSRYAMMKIMQAYTDAKNATKARPDEPAPSGKMEISLAQSDLQALKDAAFASEQPGPETIFQRNLKREYSKPRF